jgi:hypothetical protein
MIPFLQYSGIHETMEAKNGSVVEGLEVREERLFGGSLFQF